MFSVYNKFNEVIYSLITDKHRQNKYKSYVSYKILSLKLNEPQLHIHPWPPSSSFRAFSTWFIPGADEKWQIVAQIAHTYLSKTRLKIPLALR